MRNASLLILCASSRPCLASLTIRTFKLFVKKLHSIHFSHWNYRIGVRTQREALNIKYKSVRRHTRRIQSWGSQSTYIYLEYHSVCPLVRIGTPPPLPQASVPLRGRGGVHSPTCEEVGESRFRRLEKKLSTLSTLCCGWYRRVHMWGKHGGRRIYLWMWYRWKTGRRCIQYWVMGYFEELGPDSVVSITADLNSRRGGGGRRDGTVRHA